MSEPLLQVDGLSVHLPSGVEVVSDVSLSIPREVRLGLVGESGSGKTLTAMSIMGLLPKGLSASGSVKLAGKEILGRPESEAVSWRGSRVAFVPQDAMASLNPVWTVGRQIAEPMKIHGAADKRGRRERVLELLEQVKINDPDRVARSYPHQLSGGQRQRAVVATALAGDPELVIADEPTSALDATVRTDIMNLMRDLSTSLGVAMLVITHDLPVVAHLCDRVAVMYGGRVAESGSVDAVLSHPLHRYTAALLPSAPQSHLREGQRGEPLPVIPGSVPPAGQFPGGCPFRDRCGAADEQCHQLPPTVERAGQAFACWHPVEESA
jgi:peptide/nickel transport system ATP-binding protein